MDPSINFLQLGLDGASRRQQALANNISNVTTPGYKRRDVDFVSVLKEQLPEKKNSNSRIDKGLNISKTRSNHLGENDNSSKKSRPFNMYSRTYSSYRNDENSVGIDYEMAELAKNTLYYNTLSGEIAKRFSMLNEVIDRGGRN